MTGLPSRVRCRVPRRSACATGRAGSRARRQPGDQLHPARVVLLAQDIVRPSAGSIAEEPYGALVAGLHDGVRAVGVPAGARQVLEGAVRTVPARLGPRAVGRERRRCPAGQGESGVGRAGRRVTSGRGGRAGSAGSAMCHSATPEESGARDQQPGAVRGPPVAARAVQGGAPVYSGGPERDVRPVGLGIARSPVPSASITRSAPPRQ